MLEKLEDRVLLSAVSPSMDKSAAKAYREMIMNAQAGQAVYMPLQDNQSSFSLLSAGDDLPVVLIRSEDAPAGEYRPGRNENAWFKVTRKGKSDSLEVKLAVGGSATPIEDYTFSGAELRGDGYLYVTVPAGQWTTKFQINAVDDAIVEDIETVELTIAASENYAIGRHGSATRRIFDNEPVLDSITVSDNANPARTVTNTSQGTPSELYVGSTTSQGQANAVIYLDASGSPDNSTAGAQVLWQIEGGSSSPNPGNFSSNPTITLTPHESNTQNKFIVRAGVDANGDGSLNDDPGGGASEVTHAVTVYVVKIDEMFVWDNADSANIVTTPDSTPLDLYVAETINGDAKIKIDVSGRPQTSAAGANVLWSVAGNTSSPSSGNFGGVDPTVTLTPTSTNRQFVVTLGFDDNDNQTLEVIEVERTVNVHVVPLVELDIQVTTFIKQEWLDHPNEPILEDAWIFQGDNRAFALGQAIFDKNLDSYRTRQKLTVLPFAIQDSDGLKDGSYIPDVGQTVLYDKSTSLDATDNITLAARSDPNLGYDGNMKLDYGYAEKDRMLVTVTRLAPDKVKVVFDMAVNDPLITGSPDIDYDFELIIDYSNPTVPTYQITGSHDGFPCYELYIGNQAILQYDSLDETVFSLYPDQEKSINQSGAISSESP